MLFECHVLCRCEPLKEGQSGSIVYVIDSIKGYRYRLGQLIGSRKMPDGLRHPPVYQAVVLSQTLQEFEWQHKNKISNLMVAGLRFDQQQPSVMLEKLDKRELGLNQEEAESEQQRNAQANRAAMEGGVLPAARDETENLDLRDEETYNARQPEGATMLHQPEDEGYDTLGAGI